MVGSCNWCLVVVVVIGNSKGPMSACAQRNSDASVTMFYESPRMMMTMMINILLLCGYIKRVAHDMQMNVFIINKLLFK